MEKQELLGLPISVKDYLVLRHYFELHWDTEILLKLINDYYNELPLFEVYRIIGSFESHVDEDTFQMVLRHLFIKKRESCALKGGRYSNGN